MMQHLSSILETKKFIAFQGLILYIVRLKKCKIHLLGKFKTYAFSEERASAEFILASIFTIGYLGDAS